MKESRKRPRRKGCLIDGEATAIEIGSKGIEIGCCDCGLVHRLAITEVKGHTAIVRHYRATRTTCEDRAKYLFPYQRIPKMRKLP
jgi:hypothetical protein